MRGDTKGEKNRKIVRGERVELPKLKMRKIATTCVKLK